MQNLIYKLIKEIKQDRETIERESITSQPQNSINDENNNVKTLKLSNLNYSKSRSKSPRPVANVNKVINQEVLANALQSNSLNSSNSQFNISGSNTNNESSSNNSSLKNIEISNQQSSITNSQPFPTIIANNTTSAKKQSSKFPFFTKILNKS